MQIAKVIDSIRTNAAIGGSTNAVIHLTAIARRRDARERRERQGKEPLDVETEVARQLRELS